MRRVCSAANGQTPGNISGSQVAIATFLGGANSVTSSTLNSAYLTSASTYNFGQTTNEGKISQYLLLSGGDQSSGPYADDASIGTALAFYQDAASRSVIANGVAFAGTWDLTSAGALTYGGVSAVPLPTPLLLLLSGLGLMGVVARRGKTA